MIDPSIFDEIINELDTLKFIAHFIDYGYDEYNTDYTIGYMMGNPELGLSLASPETTLQYGRGALIEAVANSKVKYGQYNYVVEINAQQKRRQQLLWHGTKHWKKPQGLKPPHLFVNHSLGMGTWEFSEKVNKYGADMPFEGGGFKADKNWSFARSKGFFDRALDMAMQKTISKHTELENYLLKRISGFISRL